MHHPRDRKRRRAPAAIPILLIVPPSRRYGGRTSPLRPYQRAGGFLVSRDEAFANSELDTDSGNRSVLGDPAAPTPGSPLQESNDDESHGFTKETRSPDTHTPRNTPGTRPPLPGPHIHSTSWLRSLICRITPHKLALELFFSSVPCHLSLIRQNTHNSSLSYYTRLSFKHSGSELAELFF